MTTIVTRTGKGTPLTIVEMDTNLTNLNTDKAELASPTFTGTPAAPTATTGTNTTQLATTAFVQAKTATQTPFTATGNIAATNVQTAIAEVDTEKVAKAGDTMTGTLNVPSLNGGPLAGFRNRLINGAMQVMQRPTHTPVLGAIDYHVDRWFVYSVGAANASVGWVSTPTGGPNLNKHYISIMGASGNTLTALWQRIEAENCADLKSKVVSVSALVYTQDSRAVTFDMRYPTARDDWTGNTIQERVATSVASGWRTITTQMTMPTNAFGIEIGLDFGAVGAGLEMAVTDIQFEEGPVATPFESRPIGVERQLCYRYYYRINNIPAGTIYGPSSNVSTTLAVCPVSLPVVMRNTPAIETTGVSTNYAVYTGVWVQCNTVPVIYHYNYGPLVWVSFPTGGSLTTAQAGQCRNYSTAGFLGFSSEL